MLFFSPIAAVKYDAHIQKHLNIDPYITKEENPLEKDFFLSIIPDVFFLEQQRKVVQTGLTPEISVVNNKENNVLFHTRTGGPMHLPKALRNTVNAAALRRGEVLLMNTEK